MHKILLASTTEEENFILKRKLDSLAAEIGEMRFSSVRPQSLAAGVDSSVHLLILNAANSAREHLSQLLSTRARGYHRPLIVISKGESAETLKEMQMMNETLFLERPYEIKDLRGIVTKFLAAKPVAQQFHRRYSTSMNADVEIMSNTVKTRSTLFNLSKGGAFLEFTQAAPLRMGDELKLSIELNEMRRSYDMAARVVWITDESPNGRFGAGIEFIGPAVQHRIVLGGF